MYGLMIFSYIWGIEFIDRFIAIYEVAKETKWFKADTTKFTFLVHPSVVYWLWGYHDNWNNSLFNFLIIYSNALLQNLQ